MTKLEAAVEEGATTKGLSLVLDAWRESRTVELRERIATLSKLLDAPLERVAGTNKAAVQAAWLSVEKQKTEGDVQRLLETLTNGVCADAKVRLARVAKWKADPRVIETLIGWLEWERMDDEAANVSSRAGLRQMIPFTSAPNRSFWTATFELLNTLVDSSDVARLGKAAKRFEDEEYPTNFEEWLVPKLARTVDAASKRAAGKLDAKSALTQLDKALARKKDSGKADTDSSAALFEAVWAKPDDDRPREVLADFLSQRGDPRGEFITLQLARARGTITREGRAREKELLKAHRKSWVGPIGPLIQPHNLRFERGFLVTCQLEPNPEIEKTLGKHPAWSTIREFHIHWYSTEAKQGGALMKLLKSHGAKKASPFTRGV